MLSSYKRQKLFNKLEASAIVMISERDDILLSEAMEQYLSCPALADSIKQYSDAAETENKDANMEFVRSLVYQAL